MVLFKISQTMLLSNRFFMASEKEDGKVHYSKCFSVKHLYVHAEF